MTEETTTPRRPDPALVELIRPWVERMVAQTNRRAGDKRVYRMFKQRLNRARDAIAGLRAGVDAAAVLTDEAGFARVPARQMEAFTRFRVSYDQLAELTELFTQLKDVQATNAANLFTDGTTVYDAAYIEQQTNDLASLPMCEGIDRVEVNRDTLTVFTKPVTLANREGKKFYFGRFKMFFQHDHIASHEGNGNSSDLHVRGIDNIRPKDNSDYIHPHIRENGWFCMGEGELPIRAALARLDVASAALVGLSIIRHYNQHGEYYSVERWASPACDSCGAFMAAPGEQLEAGHVHRLGQTPDGKTICVNCGAKDQIDGNIYIRRHVHTCPSCGKLTHTKNKRTSTGGTQCCTACVGDVNRRERAARTQYTCPNCGEVHQRPEGGATWDPEVTTFTGKTGCSSCTEMRALRKGWLPVLLLKGERPNMGVEGNTTYVQLPDGAKLRLQPAPVACPNCGTHVTAAEIKRDNRVTQVNPEYCQHCAIDDHSPVLWARPNNMRAMAMDLCAQRLGAQFNQAVSYAPLFAMTPEQLKATCIVLEQIPRLLPQRGEGGYERWVEQMRRVFNNTLPFEVNDIMRVAFNNLFR